MAPSVVAKTLDVEVLSQEIGEDEGHYRIRSGNRVRYLRILTTVFDEDTMECPWLLIPQLPSLPTTDWTTMDIFRRGSGGLESIVSFDVLPAIEEIWHPTIVDVLSLRSTKRYGPGVHEVVYQDRPAIAKIACFGWEIQRRDNETFAYEIISQYEQEDATASCIAPRFLAHLTENDRVIGMLLEKLQGDAASIEDLAKCETTLSRFQSLGFIHGDVNRYNFIIDRDKGSACLIDFEHVKSHDEILAQSEMKSLRAELTEDTGRGKRVAIDVRHITYCDRSI